MEACWQTPPEMENVPVVVSLTLNIGRARPHCMGKLTGHRGFRQANAVVPE